MKTGNDGSMISVLMSEVQGEVGSSPNLGWDPVDPEVFPDEKMSKLRPERCVGRKKRCAVGWGWMGKPRARFGKAF